MHLVRVRPRSEATVHIGRCDVTDTSYYVTRSCNFLRLEPRAVVVASALLFQIPTPCWRNGYPGYPGILLAFPGEFKDLFKRPRKFFLRRFFHKSLSQVTQEGQVEFSFCPILGQFFFPKLFSGYFWVYKAHENSAGPSCMTRLAES